MTRWKKIQRDFRENFEKIQAGDYERAQMETRAAQRLLVRNFAGDSKKMAEVKQWSDQVDNLDTVLRKEKVSLVVDAQIILFSSHFIEKYQEKKK